MSAGTDCFGAHRGHVDDREGVWVSVPGDGTANIRLATGEQATALVREILAALDPADREAVIRQAAKEAGLRVLSVEQADHLVLAYYTPTEGRRLVFNEKTAALVAALRGEGVEA